MDRKFEQMVGTSLRGRNQKKLCVGGRNITLYGKTLSAVEHGLPCSGIAG